MPDLDTKPDSRCPRCRRPLRHPGTGGLCSLCLFRALNESLTAADLPPPDDASLARGRILGDYELGEEIARGGMGLVFRARQRSLGRWVAVKVVQGGALATADFLKRFRTEAEAAAALDHPNIVPIYEIGEEAGQPFFSMKLLEGGTPVARYRPGRPEPTVAARLTAKIARALHFAHQRGVLHRDVKPNNILLDSHDEPYLTDFGLARLVQNDSSLTRTLAVLGTPAYMSPEQARGEARLLTTATDVYGLGAVLYELLTGQPPFNAPTAIETVRRVIEHEPRRPSALNPSLDRDLETICLRCLEKEPGRRYDSAQSVAEDLERWLRHEPILARPASSAERLVKWIRRRPAVAALSGIALLALSVVFAVSTVMTLRLGAARREVTLQTEANRRGSVRLLLNEAQSLVENGDALLALPLLVEAVRQDTSPEGRPADQRERLGTLLRQCPTLRHVWKQEGSVLHTALSPDGLHLAVGTGKGQAQVLDLLSGDPVTPVLRHSNRVIQVAFSPDTRLLATQDEGCCAQLWDIPAGTLRGPPLPHRGDWFEPLVFSWKSDWIAANNEQSVSIWTTDGQSRQLASLPDTAAMHALAIDASNRFLLSSTTNHTLRAWDLAAGRWTDLALPHDRPVRAAFYAPDNAFIASLAEDWRVRIWDSTNGALLRRTEPHTGDIMAWALSRDTQLLVTAGFDNVVRVWETRREGPGRSTFAHRNGVSSVDFHPEGTAVVSGCYDGTARVWSLANKPPLTPKLPHLGGVSSTRFVMGGERLITASFAGEIKDWKLVVNRGAKTLWKLDAPAVLVDHLHQGQQRVTVTQSGRAQVWDPQQREPIWEGEPEHGSTVTVAAKSPDDRWLASGGSDGSVSLWEVGSPGPRIRIAAHSKFVSALRFSPDSRLVATAGAEFMVALWEVATGAPASPRMPQLDGVLSLAFGPDGRTLATAGHRAQALLWDARTGRGKALFQKKLLLNQVFAVGQIAFSPDGKQVVTASWDFTNDALAAQRWNAETGEEIRPPLEHRDGVICACYSPDGRFIATGGEDNLARVWRADTGQPVTPFLVHQGFVTQVQFSHDGRQLATASRDSTARVWSVEDGQALTPPLVHDGRVIGVSFAPDDRSLATIADDQTLRIWDLSPMDWPTDDLAELAELLAAYRLDANGERTPLTAAELQARWTSVRAKHPEAVGEQR